MLQKTRVVLDTNILISACWKPGSLEEEVLRMTIAGAVQPCATKVIWAEYQDVAGRKKFAKLADRLQQILLALEPQIHWVSPLATVQAALDEDDNRFLECADAALAQFLITGNLRDYPAHWHACQIVNARQFLNDKTICVNGVPNIS